MTRLNELHAEKQALHRAAREHADNIKSCSNGRLVCEYRRLADTLQSRLREVEREIAREQRIEEPA